MATFFFTELSKNLLSNPKIAIEYVDDAIQRMAFRSKESRGQPPRKIANSPAEAIVYLSLANKLPQPTLASDETVAREKSLFSAAMTEQYDSKTSCFLQTMEEALGKSSLTVDEKIISERFTYLEMPFKWIPKHTAAFIRRTNLSEYCVCLPGYIVKPSQVRLVTGCKDILCYEKLQFPQVLSSKSVVREIAKILGEGLLSGIMGNLAVVMFNSIFPSGVPDYFDAVYKEIERIVHKELTQNTIDQVNGHINGVQIWVKNSYTPAKESGQLTNQELTEKLASIEKETITQIIGTLMENRYAEPGLSTFMIGAGVHLCILQELALVDPRVPPAESYHLTSIKRFAQQYADFAKSTTKSIIDKRVKMIEAKKSIWPYSNNCTVYAYWWKDNLSGERSDEFNNAISFKGTETNPDAYKQRDDDMARRKSEVQQELKDKMQDPEATADLWLKLIDQPLPSQSAVQEKSEYSGIAGLNCTLPVENYKF